jgi:hypothetical protein
LVQQEDPQHVWVTSHAEFAARRQTGLPASVASASGPPLLLPPESTPLSGVLPPEPESEAASAPPLPVSPEALLSLPPTVASSGLASAAPLLLPRPPLLPVPSSPMLPLPLPPLLEPLPLPPLLEPLPPPWPGGGGCETAASIDSPNVVDVPLQAAVATTASPQKLI